MSEPHDAIPRRAFVASVVAGSAIGAPLLKSIEHTLDTAAPSRLPEEVSTFSSAAALARGIRLKRYSCVEVLDAYLARIAQVNPKINALVFSGADEARGAAREADRALASGRARGPLHGVPISIKDSFEVKGMVSTAGTPGWAKRVP